MQLRLFLAVVPPAAVVTRLTEVVERLRRFDYDVKWVEPNNMHITLKFLGEVDSELVPQLTTRVDAACQGARAFAVELKGIGTFPGQGRPRVIWVGVSSGTSELEALATAVSNAVSGLGFPKEPFTPHLTLGRVRSGAGAMSQDFKQEMRRLEAESFGCFTVREVKLMKSDLSRQGPRYSELANFHLSASS